VPRPAAAETRFDKRIELTGQAVPASTHDGQMVILRKPVGESAAPLTRGGFSWDSGSIANVLYDFQR
jgi:hypothetical protein